MPRAYEQDGVWIKVCCRCHEIKPIEEYGVDRDKPDGHNKQCKVCVREVYRERYVPATKKGPRYPIHEKDGKMVKECSACHEIKSLDTFYQTKATLDSKTVPCKACTDKAQALRYETPEALATRRAYAARNKERIRLKANEDAARRRLEHANDPVWIEHQREVKKRSAAKHMARICERQKTKRASDPGVLMLHSQRVAIRHMLRGNIKSGSSIEMLGCTPDEFVRYIETQFTEGMSWQTYGRGADRWQIDHILCGEVFDLSRPSHQRMCFHYTNLRPLWCSENAAKRDRLDDGRLAHDLTLDEKRAYLISKGFGYLFTSDPTPSACSAVSSQTTPASSEQTAAQPSSAPLVPDQHHTC